MTPTELTIIDEPSPGEAWRTLFERLWPAYKSWFAREGLRSRATYRESSKVLASTMPELVPIYERVVELAGGTDLEARFLALYRPPPFAIACSQLARGRPDPLLVRNYDFYPELWDAALLRTRWVRPVLSMVDCVWGVIDGINDEGLAVSLAFGGSNQVDDGFGMPLILRYVLEVATDVRQAVAVLEAVPSHMRYHVTVVDASGDVATVISGPGRTIEVTDRTCITNHTEGVTTRYAELTRSADRLRALEDLAAKGLGRDELFSAFRGPALATPVAGDRWGTLYTAVYRPLERALRLWTGGQDVEAGIDGLLPASISLRFG